MQGAAKSPKVLAQGIIWVVIASLVFGLQSYNVGFWAMPHALISHHVLAIFRHATPENRFSGYAQQWEVADGVYEYEYFERTPFPFSAAMHIGLRLAPDSLPDNIFASRQMMNAIFIAMMFGLWLLARRFISSEWLALAAVLLTVSSYHELYYKDMVNYDQPAILGMVLLLLAIAHYKLDAGKRWLVVIAFLIAVSLGFGFPSFFVLAIWGMTEGVRNLQARRALWRGDIALIAFTIAVGLVWSSAFVVNNMLVEASLRDVPIRETSVVDSAIRRMPFLSSLREEQEPTDISAEVQGWATFFAVQGERLALWLVPFKLAGDMRWGFTVGSDVYAPNPLRIAITAVGTVLALWFVLRQRGAKRDLALMLVFSGLLFMVVLKGFALQHTYVTMYSKGFVLAAVLSVFALLDRSKWLEYGVALLALMIFTVGLWQVRAVQTEQSNRAVAYTRDFERIRTSNSVQRDESIYVAYPRREPQCFITGNMCMAVGYYLPWNPLTQDLSLADYVIAPQDYTVSASFVDAGESVTLMSETVTPDNEIMYMLDAHRTQTRTAPDSNSPIFRFGEAITLQNWALNGDVTVQPCERREIESWWLAEDAVPSNYNMQVVMLDANSNAVTEANFPLTTVPTSLWEPERFTLEARGITVPCDTPPGEYPLIMGVYHPDTLVPLPVTDADGAAVGNQIYLTTFFVE